jgi:hypothetical protein
MLPVNRLKPASLAILVALLPAAGCRSTMGPKMPSSLTAPSVTTYKAADLTSDVAAYRAKVAGGDMTGALAMRNQMAYRVMGDIEMSYSKFEMSLTTQRAGFETGSDAVQLGISAAATVVGAAEVKDLLNASLTAFQGTRTSFDKNFFQQKTTESIISQMRATRKTKQAQLITSLAQRDAASYPWDAVWMDLIDFYYAGTVPSALVEIASNAGSKADDATKTLNKAVDALASTTPVQLKQAISNRSAYEKLKTESAGSDSATAAKAVDSLRKILTAYGAAPAADASATDLLAAFRKAIDESTSDNDKLAKLNAAVASVPFN